MTSATERIRALLDERGMEWKAPASYDGSTKYDTIVGGYWFHENDGKITVHGLTPEQAIAAMFGRRMLTAEQVRELMEANSRQYQSPTDPYVWLTEYDWQAIADELNATLGSGNCSNNCTNSERTGTCHNSSKVMDEHGQARFACSECSAWIDSRMLWNPEYRNGESPWVSGCKLNFCPNCGRRIVDPTTNDVDAEVDA